MYVLKLTKDIRREITAALTEEGYTIYTCTCGKETG